jgi:EAL domain-containing protein (putative c-di-GMP-specific phosphodiesterase class I)
MNFLKHGSCDEVQGFLFGRPQPMEAYAHLRLKLLALARSRPDDPNRRR